MSSGPKCQGEPTEAARAHSRVLPLTKVPQVEGRSSVAKGREGALLRGARDSEDQVAKVTLFTPPGSKRDPIHAALDELGRTVGVLRRYGATPSAVALEAAVEDIQQALGVRDERVLTVAEASALSGYSIDHLRRLISQKTLPNAGKRGAPRVRASDLPKRPPLASSRTLTQLHGSSRQQVARSLIKKGD